MYRKRRNKNREEQGKSKRLADIDFSYWAGNKVDSEQCNKCRYLDSHSSCRLLDISTGVQVWRNFLIKGHVPRLKRHSSVPVNEQLLMRLAWRTENKTSLLTVEQFPVTIRSFMLRTEIKELKIHWMVGQRLKDTERTSNRLIIYLYRWRINLSVCKYYSFHWKIINIRLWRYY